MSKVFRIGSVQNAIVSGKRFRARLIEPGIISYKDVGQGVALLKKSTIDRCAHTFVGAPLVLKHKSITNANKARECAENGVIDKVYFDADDGWFWCEGSVNGQGARNRINSVGRVSCGYDITQEGPGGKHHCIPYDHEITGFIGEHLAIEERPRYEDATIRLNSKFNPNNTMSMFKWFKKKPDAVKPGEDEAAQAAAKDAAPEDARLNAEANAEDISADTEIMVGESKVKISDVIAGYTANLARENAEGGDIPADATVEVDGEPVTISALVESHKARKNAVAAKPAAQPGHIFRIVSARENAAPAVKTATPDTREARLESGKKHY